MLSHLKLLHSLPSSNAGSLLSCVGEALQVRNPYEALQRNPIANYSGVSVPDGRNIGLCNDCDRSGA